MISAFTLVRVYPEKKVGVFKKIRKLAMMKELALVYGEYDIIVRTRTENIEDLNKFIYNILRRIPNVTGTTTLIVAREPERKQIPRTE